ncbi:CxC ATPase DNA modification system associated small protein [Haloglomus halophilum]|uniref:CxC ATPase DNA modification system associated small protein n=1 Tax=Haloglomus halophilum TaxID=2962672 RepID=UPI0020C9BF37|nr:hypothetical protein [Haloglomus halophilum]
MSDDFPFEDIASDVLSEYDQDEAFKTRFIGFCENAMKGSAEDGDLIRLINNVTLSEEDTADGSTN